MAHFCQQALLDNPSGAMGGGMSASSARFPISVKGVLQQAGRYLLRRNERAEYELLGGRLERGDRSFAERLCTEFLEESGIPIQVGKPLEPWVLQVGQSRILIVPYICRALHIPDVLSDMDGGQLVWVNGADISRLPMPQGYQDSIFSLPPHSSASRPAEDTRSWVKTGDEKRRPVLVQLWEAGKLLEELPLPFSSSPGGLLLERTRRAPTALPIFQGCRIDWERDAVILPYALNGSPYLAEGSLSQ